MKKAAEVLVSGVVQGVGFRWFTLQQARHLGITGYVKNLPDGRVYIRAEGEDFAIQELIEKVKIGPSFSHVTAVNVNWLEFSGKFKDFDVRF